MNKRLPTLSGREVIAALEKVGYRVVRQRGSHVRLRSPDPDRRPVVVPMHKEIKRGLLRAILRDADLTVEEFKKFL